MGAALFFAFCLFVLGIGFAVVYMTVRHHWILDKKSQRASSHKGQ